LPEVLRGAVVGGSTLVAPAPVWDAATTAAIDAERVQAEERGYTRGLAEGRAAAAAEIGRAAAAVSSAIASLRAEVVEQREAAIAVDLELVRATVDAVLGVAPPASAEIVLDRIRDAATMLDDPTLEVRLHPADLAGLEGGAFDPRLTLVADPAIGPGEAAISGTWGRADLRRAALRDAALAHLTAGDGGDVPGGVSA
jgi:flagellar biosynthesis/type III secretory pathway protein FliH